MYEQTCQSLGEYDLYNLGNDSLIFVCSFKFQKFASKSTFPYLICIVVVTAKNKQKNSSYNTIDGELSVLVQCSHSVTNSLRKKLVLFNIFVLL